MIKLLLELFIRRYNEYLERLNVIRVMRIKLNWFILQIYLDALVCNQLLVLLRIIIFNLARS